MRLALRRRRFARFDIEVLPDGTITLNGEPIVLNGEYLTLGSA